MKILFFLNIIYVLVFSGTINYEDNILNEIGKMIINQNYDIAKIKLMIDSYVDPTIDINQYLKKIDEIEKKIRAMSKNSSTQPNIEDINRYFYEAGPWNNNQVYQYNIKDPLAKLPKTGTLSQYLDTKRGNCVSMPLLYYVLAQRFNLAIYVVNGPHHMYLRAYGVNNTNEVIEFNIEATNKGKSYSNEYYVQKLNPSKKTIENKLYLRPLKQKEVVSYLMNSLGVYTAWNKEYKKSLKAFNIALILNPKNIDAIALKGGLFHKMLESEIKYYDGRTIPQEAQAHIDDLRDKNIFYVTKALSMGWTDRTDEDEKKYLEEVNFYAKKYKL